MPETAALLVFLSAAIVLAITPGPGIFYVLARSLRGGRGEGIRSSLGTAIGGFGHVLAAACGLSAVLASSAAAFAVVKYVGAAYLVYLGIRTLMASEAPAPPNSTSSSHDAGAGLARADRTAAPAARRARASRDHALGQGVITELLNPKTALFFLAFIPQFIDPHGVVFAQFVLLGSISVALNTSADLLVALFGGPIGRGLRRSPRFRRRTRLASGSALIGLGAYAALADNRR